MFHCSYKLELVEIERNLLLLHSGNVIKWLRIKLHVQFFQTKTTTIDKEQSARHFHMKFFPQHQHDSDWVERKYYRTNHRNEGWIFTHSKENWRRIDTECRHDVQWYDMIWFEIKTKRIKRNSFYVWLYVCWRIVFRIVAFFAFQCISKKYIKKHFWIIKIWLK